MAGKALASRLTKRVMLQSEQRAPNGQGGFVTSWATLATPWVEIIGLTGDESIAAAVERSVQRWRVTMRRREPPVGTKMRLVWGTRELNIKSVVPDPQAPDDAVVCICESVG